MEGLAIYQFEQLHCTLGIIKRSNHIEECWRNAGIIIRLGLFILIFIFILLEWFSECFGF